MTSRSSPRVLIVGCGRIAGGFNETDETKTLTHIVAYRRLGADVVACCDRHSERAAAFARRWSIPYHTTDLDDALRRAEPEIVSVCTPPDARRQIVDRLAIAETVRAVLLEKPIADGLDAAIAVQRAAHAAGLTLIVNYFRAFDPFYRNVSELCREERLGAVREMMVRYYGSARDNASHMLERVLDVVGTDARATRLSGASDAPTFLIEARMLRAGSDAQDVRALFVPTETRGYAPMELDILFDRGRLRIVDSEGRVEATAAVPDPDFEGFSLLAPIELPGLGRPDREGLAHAIAAVLRAAHDGDGNAGCVDRAVAVTRLLDEVTA